MNETSTTTQIHVPTTRENHRVRLLLSGGGNRAMMGSAGTIAYLAQHGWWDNIDEVVSVSGGSVTNAALMTGGTETAEDTFRSLTSYYSRATEDIGRPLQNPKRFGFLGLIVLPVLTLILLILMSVGLVPGPDAFQEPIVGLVLGLLAPSACSLVVRRGAAGYLGNYLGALTNGFAHRLGGFGARRRQHVICASGLSTAQPYYLWGGGSTFFAGGDLSLDPVAHEPESLWGAPLQGDYLVADATFASASLPTLARVETTYEGPARANSPATATDNKGRTELLVDGGVSGIFGGQVSAGMKRQSKQRSSPEGGHIIVVDSGRHVRPPSPVGRLIQRVSISGLLARWLQVSLETNYQRDLLELDDAHLIRIAEGQSEQGPEADSVRARFDELRRRTATMGLFNYNPERARNAFVTGWVGAALCLDPACSVSTVEAGLRSAGIKMERGDEFAQHWLDLG